MNFLLWVVWHFFGLVDRLQTKCGRSTPLGLLVGAAIVAALFLGSAGLVCLVSP
jgi:hypothetical protein